MTFGLIVWIGYELYMPEDLVPPQLAGLAAAFFGMIVGSLAFRELQRPAPA